MRYTWAFVLLVIAAHGTVAQSPWSVGGRVHYGYLWPHRPSSWVLVEGHALAYEAFAEREVSGARTWHHHYLLPSYGLGLLYTDLANPGVIGAAVRVLPYVHLPMIRGERSDLGIRMGWGVGYVTKAYDRTENIKQIAIGSRVNAAIQFMLECRHRVGRTRMSAGLGVDHWSNGAFRMPNLGLNMLALNLGASYALGSVPSVVLQLDTTPFRVSKRTHSVVAGFGICETLLPLSGQYSAYSLMGQLDWQLSRKSGVAAGFDVFNKGTLITIDANLAGRSRFAYTQVGIHGGYSLRLGASSIFVQMGAYVYTPALDASQFFHRLGLRHSVGKHVLLNMSLKSHFAVADHWEFGAGYTW